MTAHSDRDTHEAWRAELERLQARVEHCEQRCIDLANRVQEMAAVHAHKSADILRRRLNEARQERDDARKALERAGGGR